VLKFIIDWVQYVRVKHWCHKTWVHHYMPESKWWSLSAVEAWVFTKL